MGVLRKKTEAFVETEVDDEILLVDMAGGQLFALDGSARAVWRLIDGTRDRAALVAALAPRYDAAPETIARDCDALLAELAAAGLIASG